MSTPRATVIKQVRQTGLELVEKAGHPVEIIPSKSPSFNVRLGKDMLAHVKVATSGNPIIRALSNDTECSFNGLTDSVTHLLLIRRDRKTEAIEAYLMPKNVALSAFRAAWKQTLGRTYDNPPSDAVSINFNKKAIREQFSEYLVGSQPAPPPALTIDQAKAGLAVSYAVPVEAVKISIEM